MPWGEEAGRFGEGSRDAAQMQPDPNTSAVVPDGDGSGGVGVGSRRLKVPRGLSDLPASGVRMVLDGALCDFQAPRFLFWQRQQFPPGWLVPCSVLLRWGWGALQGALLPQLPHIPGPLGVLVHPPRAGTRYSSHPRSCTHTASRRAEPTGSPMPSVGITLPGAVLTFTSPPTHRHAHDAAVCNAGSGFPSRALGSISKAAPRLGLDPSGCSKAFVSVTVARPSALIAAAITSTSVQGLKRATKHKGKVLGGEACPGYFQARCNCICQNC